MAVSMVAAHPPLHASRSAEGLPSHPALRTSGAKTKADTLVRARELIAMATPVRPEPQPPDNDAAATATAKPAHPCPCCGASMVIIETFEAGSTPRHRPRASLTVIRIDTS